MIVKKEEELERTHLLLETIQKQLSSIDINDVQKHI